MGNSQGKSLESGEDGGDASPAPTFGQMPTMTAPIPFPSPQRQRGSAGGVLGGGSSVPGSPLTYGPQPLMEPLMNKAFTVTHAAARNKANQPPAQEFHGVPGWPQQGTLVPTVLIWSHGGESVEVEGSWDNWTSRLSLLKSGKDFTVVKLLMPGVYQFKFIVDGTWKYAPDQSAIFDEMGNVNNVVEVQEYVPENIESISSFDLPASPRSSYTNDRMVAEDFVKDPPLMPQHLNLTLLNVPQFVEAPAALPRPQHVILNHVYETHKTKLNNKDTHVLGMTYRYKSKYVTQVYYKSKGSAASASS